MIVEAMLACLSLARGSDSILRGQFNNKDCPRVVASAVAQPFMDKTHNASEMLAISILGSNYPRLLSFGSLKRGWNGYDGEEIPPSVINSAMGLLMSLSFHPSIFPTGRGSIQIEYYMDDDNFAEIEVFSDHISAYSEGIKGTIEEASISEKEARALLETVYGR